MKKQNTFKLTLLALFTAIMIIMDFTPIGYIVTPYLSITLMTIPVAIGAVCLGVSSAVYLSFLFGLTSFLMCFNIGFMPDKTAPLMLEANPVGTVIVCFVTRIIAGLITALVFLAFKKNAEKNYRSVNVIGYSVSCACMPVFNTLLFLSGYFFFFGNTSLGTKFFKAVITAAFTVNGLVELVITVIVGSFVAKTLDKYLRKISAK
ncbi:MAG: ECF transporter S component [Clostridia bacterium]|nr:ECF transporter S component [Clostridia bacterium]